MHAAIALVIILIWLACTAIVRIAKSIEDGKRKRIAEQKRLEQEQIAEQKRLAKESWLQKRDANKLLNESNKKRWTEEHKAWEQKVLEEQHELSMPIYTAYVKAENAWKNKIKDEQNAINTERLKRWQDQQDASQREYDSKLSAHEKMLTSYKERNEEGVLYYNEAVLTLQNTPDVSQWTISSNTMLKREHCSSITTYQIRSSLKH
ncbi:MAG: hypothetical protein JO182_20640 [Acidobacteriaceae bacterium]|nr:hypothetical protein [Acidobacteriaceae bacterium]